MARHNVLVILCDQLTPRVLGCYGGPVSTPNIDRLATEGVRFTDAVCPTPRCSPSRASIATGMYPHSHGITHNVTRTDYPAASSPPTEEGIKSGEVTIGRLHAEAGFRTHHYGKWHLTDDCLDYYPDMFREHHGYAQGMAPAFERTEERPREEWMDWGGWRLPVERSDTLRDAVEPTEDWADDVLGGLPNDAGGWRERITKMGRLEFDPEDTFDVQVADRAVDRIREVGEPFCLTCSFLWPHDPNVVPSPYYEAFDTAEIELPENFDAGHEPRFDEELSARIADNIGEGMVREFLRIYYGCVRLLDDQVGRLLAALEETGRLDRTVVVFTADHGDMAGGHGWTWKQTEEAFYEELVQVPLLVRGPDIQSGRELEVAASLVDLLPTLAELNGQSVPDRVEGRSLAPYLRGERESAAGPTYAFAERVGRHPMHTREVRSDTPASFMVRGDGWKYVRYADGGEHLYHLEEDPGERREVSDTHEHRVETFRETLDGWLERTGYPEAR